MVRKDLCISVPSFFKCPISLDVMKSPVSLCTGVTYDRSSIQAWLDKGNNTCPATMQVLDSKDFVPNHTLHRLIQVWSNSSTASDVSHLHRISNQQARDLVKNISNGDESSLTKIAEFAKISDENRKFLACIDGFVPVLVDLIRNVDLKKKKIGVIEQAVKILDQILVEYKEKDETMRSMARNGDILASFVSLLQRGSLDSKIGSVRILEAIATDAESKIQIAETQNMLIELFHMISSSEADESAITAALSCLIAISVPRRIKIRIVRLGAVQTLGKLLASDSVTVTENTMKMLEMVCSCTEGRTAICEDDKVVSDIVQKMLKVSKVATEHGAVILWSVCYLFRDHRAQEAVTNSNGLTKILLLMQSNCSPSVRHMCSDLMKIFRVNSKSCLSSYDTKTTHIMPF